METSVPKGQANFAVIAKFFGITLQYRPVFDLVMRLNELAGLVANSGEDFPELPECLDHERINSALQYLREKGLRRQGAGRGGNPAAGMLDKSPLASAILQAADNNCKAVYDGLCILLMLHYTHKKTLSCGHDAANELRLSARDIDPRNKLISKLPALTDDTTNYLSSMQQELKKLSEETFAKRQPKLLRLLENLAKIERKKVFPNRQKNDFSNVFSELVKPLTIDDEVNLQGKIKKLFEFSSETEEPPSMAVVFEADAEVERDPIIFDVAVRKAKSWVQRAELLSKVDTARLNDIEKKQFVMQLKQQMEKDFGESVFGFAIALIYLLGLNLDQVVNTRWGAIGFIDLHGQLRKILPKPPKLFRSIHDDLHEKVFTLPLSKMMNDWLKKHASKLMGSDTLLSASKMSEIDFTAEVQNTLDSWRENTRYRFKLSKISAALSSELTYQTRNPLLITTINGDLKAEPPVLMYYQYVKKEECQQAYLTATNTLLSIPEDLLGGHFSSTTKIPETISNFIRGISVALKASLKNYSASVINSHNHLMHYTLAMMLFATGHRPVRDPFCYLYDVDINDEGVLISDKVVSPRHEFRYQVLPEIVRDQLNAYRRHLKQLAARLYRDKSLKCQQLGMKIIYSLEKEQQLLPIFFELDEMGQEFRSLTQKDIQAHWEQFADIPANAGRSMICQLLTDKGVRPGLIELYLGHISGLSHRHGQRAGHAPSDDFKILKEEIASAMKTLGWEVTKPYEKSRPRVKLPKTFNKRLLNFQKVHIFGPIKRELHRLGRKNQIKEIVATARDEIIGEQNNRYSHELVADFLYTVKRNCISAGLSTQDGITLGTRWLNRISQSGVSVSTYKVFRALPAESSVISLGVFRDWQQCQKLQKSLLADFSRNVRPDTVEQFLVELITIAAVFGGLAKPELLKMLPEQIFSNAYRTDKKTVIVEFEQSRWLPDTLSLSRIMFIRRHYASEQVSTVLVGLDKHISKYLKKHGLTCTLGNVYSKLAGLAQSLNTWHMPGTLHGYWNAKNEGKHLPMHRLASLLTNKQYRPTDTKEKKANSDAPIWVPAINNQSSKLLSATESWQDIKAIFLEVEKTLPESSNKRKKALKSKLTKQLMAYAQQDNVSATCQALIAWFVERCRKGLVKENLASSSIKRYATEIVYPILALSTNDLRTLDEDEFEELYFDCLELFSCNKAYRLGRLFDFHQFLQKHLSLPYIHWSALFALAGLEDSTPNVDANILTVSEYDQAIQIINDDEGITSWLKARLIVTLMMGYRFGLRFGETFRLRGVDVQSEGQKVFLQLRGSVYGDLKTRAGVRQIPLVGHLSDLEKKSWETVIFEVSHWIEQDHQTLLLFDGNSSRVSIDRSKTQDFLNKLLKYVSCDESVHFHHLRHSYANRLMAYAYHLHDPFWQQISHRLIGRFGTQHLPLLWSSQDESTVKLQSIADVMGHASIRTTVSSYFHFPEVLGRAFHNQHHPDTSPKIMSYLLGQLEPTLQKRRERSKNKKTLQAYLSGEPLKKVFPFLTVKLQSVVRQAWGYKSSHKTQPITPGLIDSILVQSARMRNIAQLHWNSFSPDVVEKVKKTAAIAQTNTQFGFYQVHVLDLDRIGGYVSETNRIFEENVLEAQRLIVLFSMIDKKIADGTSFDDEGLARLMQLDLGTWRSDSRYGNCWRFSRVSSLSAFAEIMAFLPLNEARFKLIHPTALILPDDLHTQLREQPAQFEISGDEQLLNGAVLKITSLPPVWKTVQTFNRVLFCLLLWCFLEQDRMHI